MAKRHSIAATEVLLEHAVKHRDAQKIKIATSMLQHALLVKPDPYIRIDRKGKVAHDAYQGQLRPHECKPEDCQGCFWLTWCEMKKHEEDRKSVV